MSLSGNEIKNKIIKELEKAEAIWKEVGELFEKAEKTFALGGVIPSKIPGFPFLEDNKPKVADFIAMVLDIRDATNHLTIAISEKKAKASQLKRVLYETTAVNTAGLLIVKEQTGGITEFLGDGFLAFFLIRNECDPKEVHCAYNAAKKCISVTTNIINPLLLERYGLPPLKIGIGLAYSQAIVTIVGSDDNLHPKAMGECVYRASKLSFGTNEIFIDEQMEALWPTNGGTLNFIELNNLHLHRGRALTFKGFKIEDK